MDAMRNVQRMAKLHKCTPNRCTYPRCEVDGAPKLNQAHCYRVEYEVAGHSDSMEIEATSYADAGFKVGMILAIRHLNMNIDNIKCLDALRVW